MPKCGNITSSWDRLVTGTPVLCTSGDLCKNHSVESIMKYQGVKEFHLLAIMGCGCIIIIFIPLKLEISCYSPSKGVVVTIQWFKMQPMMLLLKGPPPYAHDLFALRLLYRPLCPLLCPNSDLPRLSTNQPIITIAQSNLICICLCSPLQQITLKYSNSLICIKSWFCPYHPL